MKGFYRYAVQTADTMMTDKMSWGKKPPAYDLYIAPWLAGTAFLSATSMGGATSMTAMILMRSPGRKGMTQAAREAARGCQRGGKGHLGLGHEPCGSDYVENCSGKDHGDEHYGIFASAGFISAKFVVEETRDESHRDVSNDITACDAEGNANPSGPAGKDGNADAAEQYIDNLAESSEFRAEEDSREENRKGRERDRDFSCQRHGEGSQYAGNCGAEGAENKIVCCHFHDAVNLRIV